MPARLDPFIDLLLKSGGDEIQLLPDEPVLLLKDGGAPQRLSKQPLTDKHVYALLTEVAPPEAANRMDLGQETHFEYAADRGLVQVSVHASGGRLSATIARAGAAAPSAPAAPPAPAAPSPAATAAARFSAQTRKPRLSVVVAPPPDAATTAAPSALPAEFADARYQAGERALGALLRRLVDTQSSDLHLRVGEPPVFRTHGEMVRQDDPPVSDDQLDVMILSIMPDRNRQEWRETGDTDFAYEIAGVARFRVNAARDRKGSVAVFRVIPAKVVTVEEMGITKEVQQLCYLTKGLVLVTGPTGSGKSTTLCAMIDWINKNRTDHIITIEDPVEFVHPNLKCLVNQREVGLNTKSFKNALRAALREDPDIVLVGEMRDLE
ncbi:MAG TPA: ATPase, T2SS/T4P/T4SS family, partial [Gemmatimonadales bacterium]|nr:ATPase, T2SS/T4P/T4SS family [Gemmatimonadales bacterium]